MIPFFVTGVSDFPTIFSRRGSLFWNSAMVSSGEMIKSFHLDVSREMQYLMVVSKSLSRTYPGAKSM